MTALMQDGTEKFTPRKNLYVSEELFSRLFLKIPFSVMCLFISTSLGAIPLVEINDLESIFHYHKILSQFHEYKIIQTAQI